MRKMFSTIGLAGLITFSLFAVMAALVANNQSGPTEPKPTIPVTVMQAPDDSKVNKIERPKPKPPEPPKAQPKPTKMAADTSSEPTSFARNITMPQVQTSAGVGSFNKPTDSDARPVVRVNPKYPIKAATQGIEGWVLLSFNISEIGSVTNVQVIDSEPKRTFDSAAKKALKKWKYRAKVVNGKAITQENLTVQLDFTMAQNS